LGVLGGAWILAVGYFTTSTVFAGPAVAQTQPAFLNSFAALAMPVASLSARRSSS
jgi:hypothetical protein